MTLNGTEPRDRTLRQTIRALNCLARFEGLVKYGTVTERSEAVQERDCVRPPRIGACLATVLRREEEP